MPECPTFVEVLVRNVRVDDATGCWNWISTRSLQGYGKVTFQGRTRNAHRWAWENIRGPIPDDLQVDHLCRNRLCVNPRHLEVVTPQVNTVRSYEARGIGPTCGRGHPRLVYGYKAKSGRTHCRECARQREWLRRGVVPRIRRTVCALCGRTFAEHNLSRHEAACRRRAESVVAG